MKKGFTLAEVMITLTVIGIIMAVILPVAIHSKPDESVMKFKKAHNTLGAVIRELISSDKYYLNGDLGVRANGEILKTKNENDVKYLCETIADVVNAKKVNCSIYGEGKFDSHSDFYDIRQRFNSDYKDLDTICKENTFSGEEITLNDGVIFYQTVPYTHFGYILTDDPERLQELIEDDAAEAYVDITTVSPELLEIYEWYSMRVFTTPCIKHCDDNVPTSSSLYKVFCIDIDGINKGEDPFGYGIRVDGKILLGARAKEWIDKSIQGEN